MKLTQNKELALIVDDKKTVQLDKMELWQVDQVTAEATGKNYMKSSGYFLRFDKIFQDWLLALNSRQWHKIKYQKSLFGIPLPVEGVKMWRCILKEESLRSVELALGNHDAGSHAHLWNMWTEECISKYLSPMEKELLSLVDQGFLYTEIGKTMLEKYGDSFWKKRKSDTKTTPSQVVNNYLHWKMPNNILRKDLTELVFMELKRRRAK